MPENTFIQKRLDALQDIDGNIVTLLDKMSGLFDTYAEANTAEDPKSTITQHTNSIYQTISDVAINLRKEVKIMDENLGVYDKNEDNIMILPIPVDQKNTHLGKKRLKEEIQQLDKLIDNDEKEDKSGKDNESDVEMKE